MELKSNSPQETKALGEKLALLLFPGAIVALVGELGSGKTTFIKGVVKALGFDPNLVRSQSFLLINEYPTRIPIYHLDLYRLDNLKQIYSLDLDYYFDSSHIKLIEWGEKLLNYLTMQYLEVKIKIKSETQRILQFIPYGYNYEKLIKLLCS